MSIFFWFNPLLRTYKKIFIQLHEFEADARAVANREVNDYCSLLARVALQSADFKIASHFNQSLTVKRINMMRTFKTKIRKWKLVAVATVAPMFFIAIACQDQVADDLQEIAANSSAALIVPPHVQARYDQLRKENPASTYVMIQPNEAAMEKIKELEAKYGLPRSVEVFKDNTTEEAIVGKGQVKLQSDSKVGVPNGFVIIEYNAEIRELANATVQDPDQVYAVVEQMPQYVGGLEALGAFMADNINYPTESSSAGIEGTVYTQFIVNKDGSISDVTVLNGLDEKCNHEAIRVVGSMPKWVPGKQNGKTVKVKYVVPVRFKLG
jgi:TonB family protein